jgi:hypothetical protein
MMDGAAEQNPNETPNEAPHTQTTSRKTANTQRKILPTLWTLWLNGKDFDPNRFSRSQPIDV